MVKYRLFHFNVRGRGEVIRMIFAAADQEYEDIRFDHSSWPEYQSKAPLGHAPWLEIHDNNTVITLSQSTAISRYLAKKFGLSGQNELETAQIEMYADQITDILVDMINAHKEEDENRKLKLKEKLITQTLPEKMKLFEQRLVETESGYFASSGLSYADLQLLTILEFTPFLGDRKEKFLDDFPNIKKLEDNIRALPRISAYLAKRPPSEY